MKRRHSQVEEALLARRRRAFRASRPAQFWDRADGFWRKRHPLDCGNTRCGLCHAYDEPKRRNTEKRSAIDYELTA